jgi:hypothetical protein
MTKQKILEGNRLIVNFMGIRPIYNSYTGTFQWGDGVFFRCGNILYEKTMDDIVAYVKYSTSWDWIMPVLQKCLTLGDNTDQWDVLYNSLQYVDVSMLFESIVEFITWYNENKE